MLHASQGAFAPWSSPSPSAGFPAARVRSSGSCPGWSAIITRSGLNGNLPLHPINRQQSHYKASERKLQAFLRLFFKFFSSFFELKLAQIPILRGFPGFILSTHPGVSHRCERNFSTNSLCIIRKPLYQSKAGRWGKLLIPKQK